MNAKPTIPQRPSYWLIESTTLTWPYRLLLTCAAFAGSAIYAWSFTHVPQREQWLPAASAVGIAAGVSWVLFGLLLLAITRTRPSIWAWADACLVTMAAGMTIKITTVAANFIWRANRLAMRPILAAGLWFGALNGIFAVVMLGLHAAGWFH